MRSYDPVILKGTGEQYRKRLDSLRDIHAKKSRNLPHPPPKIGTRSRSIKVDRAWELASSPTDPDIFLKVYFNNVLGYGVMSTAVHFPNDILLEY